MLKIFVGTIPYHINVNSAHAFFVGLIFVAAIDYENIFTTKISRFTISLYCGHLKNYHWDVVKWLQ